MGVRKLPSGRYQIDWRDESGARHRETLGYNKTESQQSLKNNPIGILSRGSSVVEHWSEKPGVVSSILTPGIYFSK